MALDVVAHPSRNDERMRSLSSSNRIQRNGRRWHASCWHAARGRLKRCDNSYPVGDPRGHTGTN